MKQYSPPINTLDQTTKGSTASRGLPFYVPTTVAGDFNPAKAHYNVKESNTRGLRNALGKARSGLYFGEIVVVGASVTSGCTDGTGATVHDRLNAWPMAMRDEWERLGVPVAGTGLVRTQDNTNVDSRWTYTGTWDGTQGTYRFASVAVTATFTTDRGGDRAQVRYYDYGDSGVSTFTINVNGAGATTVASTAVSGWKYTTVTGTIAAGQSVVITRTAGNIALSGINVYKSTGGMLVHNIAQGSSTASGTGNAAWSDASTLTSLGSVFANVTLANGTPDAVFIDLGSNDIAVLSATNATITTAITTVRNRWPSAEVYLIGTIQMSPTYMTAARWEDFLGNALYPLADTFGCPLIDVRARFGDYSQTFAEVLTVDGIGHLLSQAYIDEGVNISTVVPTKFTNPRAISGLPVGTTDTQTLTNKTITAPLGIVKGDVGLGSVDNTSDAGKPISTLQAAGLAAKVDLAPVVTRADTTVATTETAIASWTLAANSLTATRFLQGQWFGQTSSTATLTFRIRCGPSATAIASRALVAVFTTSAAGVANQHAQGQFSVACLTTGVSGTVAGDGFFMLNNAVLAQTVAAYAAATVDTTVANVLSVSVVQSAVNTLTSRAANLNVLA